MGGKSIMGKTSTPLRLPKDYYADQIAGNILLAKKNREGGVPKGKLYDLISRKEIRLNYNMPDKILPIQLEELQNGNILLKGATISSSTSKETQTVVCVLNEKGEILTPIFQNFPRLMGSIIAAIKIGEDNYTVWDCENNQKLLENVQTVREIKNKKSPNAITLAFECTLQTGEKYVIAN